MVDLAFHSYSLTSLSCPHEEVLSMWADNGNALRPLFDYIGIAPESSHNVITMFGVHGDESMDDYRNMSPGESST